MMSVNLHIDEEGICSACRVAEKFEELKPEFWEQKKKPLTKVKGFDCLLSIV